MNLKSIDLNLLVVFKALAENRSVTKAAGELGLSQPAMSHALNRLRETFDDELFIRTPKGMVPTEKSIYLESLIFQKLDELEKGLFLGDAFDPLTTSKKFKICGSDLTSLNFLPKLMGALKSEAPFVDIQTSAPNEITSLDDIESGKIDLGIGVKIPRRKDFFYETIFKDEHVGVTRVENKNIGRKVSIEKFADAQHLLVAPLGGDCGPIDDSLAEHGLTRRKSVVTTQFGDVPWYLMERDLIVCLPRSTARKFCEVLPLKTFKLPVKMQDLDIEMVWHRRTNTSQAHQWLRGMTREYFVL